MRPKVSVIGTGDAAVAAVQRLSEAGPFDVVFYDPSGRPTAGRTLDLEWSGAIRGQRLSILGSSDPAETAGSDILVLTPGDSGDVDGGADTLSMALDSVMAYSENPVLVLAAADSSSLCHVARSVSGLPGSRVIGTGTLPDTARLRVLIARELGLSVECVEALAVGQSGRMAMPLMRFSTASGVPVSELLETDRVTDLVRRFRCPNGGEEAEAAHTPSDALAAAIARIVTAVGLGQADLLPCTVMLEGEYGLRNVFLSLPALLGSGGVERVVELDLRMEELVPLRLMAQAAVA